MKLSRRKLSEHAVQRLLNGDNVMVVMKQLGAHLIDTRRTRELELVVRDIEAGLLANGTALATIVSARSLSDEAKQDIEKLIKTDNAKVQNVVFRERIEPEVIGGVRIELPGSVADFTVKAKLDKLLA